MSTDSDPHALLREAARIIERERADQGLSQDELGRRSGMAQSTVSKYLRVNLHMSVSQFDALCQALGLNPGRVMVEADGMRNGS